LPNSQNPEAYRSRKGDREGNEKANEEEGRGHMAVIDPDGLFGGDRIGRCSNAAQLHWPRLFLASDEFGRIEINYPRIVGRAYGTFNPTPVKEELSGWINEYSRNWLLFLYEVDGRWWGQWESKPEAFKKYKTKIDMRSPVPPEPEFTDWKKRYRSERKRVNGNFRNISETFLYGGGIGGGVGVGIGDLKTCASDDARLSDSLVLSIDYPPFESLEPNGMLPGCESLDVAVIDPASERKALVVQQEKWFVEWWAAYWRKESRKPAWEKFKRLVLTEDRFREVMKATRAQTPAMLSKELCHRPLGATWLFQERWTDEVTVVGKQETQGERIARKIREGA
jgi:hypothetical protein